MADVHDEAKTLRQKELQATTKSEPLIGLSTKGVLIRPQTDNYFYFDGASSVTAQKD